MKFIDRIELNYFRSAYNIAIKDLTDLNVFVGGNDSGKSNFLRALNLFFNNETGYQEDLDFLEDVTHFRQKEAQSAKGRLTIWIKVHFTNTLGWNTLPKKFWIKKSWNRYFEEPEITTNIQSKSTLTRYLNKIAFHYVPAVKERDIFSSYLALLYQTLANQEKDVEFEEPANTLSIAINLATQKLSERIESRLLVKSSIRIPTDFQTIFENMEFSTKQDEFDVPLANRGDGLQVRHIPHILDYISRNNKKLNIWGYEEPENSLEMSNCFDLADEFLTVFSEPNQIFITSHSPAFYGLSSKHVTHHLVKKEPRISKDGKNEVTSISHIDDMDILDQELGVAQLVMQRSAAAYEEIKALRLINERFAQLNKPILLTEGRTDKPILELAWKKLRPDTPMPFVIESCHIGTNDNSDEKAGAGQLKKVLEATTSVEKIIKIGLFDNDPAGRKCFQNLKNHTVMSLADTVKINQNCRSASFMLPELEWNDKYYGLTQKPVTIEIMFPRDVFEDHEVQYRFETKSGVISADKAENLIDRLGGNNSDARQLIVVTLKFPQKSELLEKFRRLPADKFANFEKVFVQVDLILKHLNVSI